MQEGPRDREGGTESELGGLGRERPGGEDSTCKGPEVRLIKGACEVALAATLSGLQGKVRGRNSFEGDHSHQATDDEVWPGGSGGSGVRPWICLEGREQEWLTGWVQSERERGIADEVEVLNNWQDAVAITCDEGRPAWAEGTEHGEPSFAG